MQENKYVVSKDILEKCWMALFEFTSMSLPDIRAVKSTYQGTYQGSDLIGQQTVDFDGDFLAFRKRFLELSKEASAGMQAMKAEVEKDVE
jgi:hypothetical protein